MKKTYVSVIGASVAGDRLMSVAEEVGRLLAEAGIIVVCGGLGGVMEAAAKGVASAGGTVLGILPGDDRSNQNAYLSISLPTNLGEARNVLVVRAGQAVIAIGGGYGTLSEIGLALKLERPVIGVETWEMSGGQEETKLTRVTGAAEAVGAVLQVLGKTIG